MSRLVEELVRNLTHAVDMIRRERRVIMGYDTNERHGIIMRQLGLHANMLRQLRKLTIDEGGVHVRWQLLHAHGHVFHDGSCAVASWRRRRSHDRRSNTAAKRQSNGTKFVLIPKVRTRITANTGSGILARKAWRHASRAKMPEPVLAVMRVRTFGIRLACGSTGHKL